MAAGVVIHALSGEQDIRKMGGLGRLLPWTFRYFLVGALALAAIPPFAGFFSKDAILASAAGAGDARLDPLGDRRDRGVPDGALHLPARLHRVLPQALGVRRAEPPQGALRGAALDDVAGRRARDRRDRQRVPPVPGRLGRRRHLDRARRRVDPRGRGRHRVVLGALRARARDRWDRPRLVPVRPRQRPCRARIRARAPWPTGRSSTSSTSTRPTTTRSTSPPPASRSPLTRFVERPIFLAPARRDRVRGARDRLEALGRAERSSSAPTPWRSPSASPSCSSSSCS